MSQCEVCDALLDRRTTGTICYQCRHQGATFRRRWMADLLASGHTWAQVQEIVGSQERSPALLRAAAAR